MSNANVIRASLIVLALCFGVSADHVRGQSPAPSSSPSKPNPFGPPASSSTTPRPAGGIGSSTTTTRPASSSTSASTSSNQAIDPGAQAQAQKKLDEVVKRLTEEAYAIDNLTDEKKAPTFVRPHPAMANWGTEMGDITLRRMAQPFTGDAHRDAYIRWHLIHLLKDDRGPGVKALPQIFLRSKGSEIRSLFALMPPPLRLPYKVETTYEPVEIYHKYRQAMEKTAVVVGYPPFTQRHEGEAALPHVTGARKAEIEALIKEAAELRGQWKSNFDRSAQQFNIRLTDLNFAIRELRGDALLLMIQTGDPAIFNDVIAEIGRQISTRQRVGFDLMSYLYVAAFDRGERGLFRLYGSKPDVLQKAARELEAIGRANDTYAVYFDGKDENGKDIPPHPNLPDRERNFADYAFHMVNMLRDNDPVAGDDQNTSAADSAAIRYTARRAETITGETLDLETIQDAVARAIKALRAKENEPRYTLQYDLNMRRGWYQQDQVNQYGNHALVCWSLLAAGQTYQDPVLYRRVNWVLSSDNPYTYDRGMRAQMLAELPVDRWGPWVRRDALWLTGALTTSNDQQKPELGGNFTSRWTGGTVSNMGDHANGQYGMLGLWGAARGRFLVQPDLWRRIDAHWRATQQISKDGRGGWSVVPKANEKQAGERFGSRVSGPMTAGGVAALCLTERFLKPQGNATSIRDYWDKNPQLPNGLRWLDENFSLDDSEESFNWHYYMWTMQFVSRATGYRTFNNVDCFRDITARMLKTQDSSGMWTGGPNFSKLVSTSFALLYLSRADDPLAISKIRFRNQDKNAKNDLAWHNRPNDVANFADFISDECEVATTWQIIDLGQSVAGLIESPILYLSTDSAFSFTDAELKNLRDYLDAGGTLVTNAEGTEGQRSINVMLSKLFPNRKLEPVDPKHPIYSVHKPVRAATLQAISNGVRPMVIHTGRDISEGLQSGDPARQADSFNLLANVYVYTVGKNVRRARLANNYVVQRPGTAGDKIFAARIRHSGNFDPEPAATSQLKAILANRMNYDLQVSTVRPVELTSQQKIAFLTTVGDGQLSNDDLTGLRRWIESGGTLWIDACGGSEAAAENARKMLAAIVPDAPVDALPPLDAEHPIITGEQLRGGVKANEARNVRYRFFTLHRMGRANRPRLQAVEINGRPAIIFSGEDLTAGVAGMEHWGIFGYTPESARRLVANGCAAAAMGINATPRQ